MFVVSDKVERIGVCRRMEGGNARVVGWWRLRFCCEVNVADERYVWFLIRRFAREIAVIVRDVDVVEGG